MEYETGHHYSQNPSLGYGHHYYYNNRNMPLTASQDNRSSSRVYPIGVGGPVGGSGPPASMRRENMESSQSRRRIAVAVSLHQVSLALNHFSLTHVQVRSLQETQDSMLR